MNAPAVAQIEEAIDVLTATPRIDLATTLKEFKELGPGRKKTLREKTLALSDMERGYLLGLQTARQMLQGMPQAVEAGITL